MDIFAILVPKMIPLYIMIAIGFVAQKYLSIRTKTVSTLLIYILSPGITFYGIYSLEFKVKYLLLPLIFFLIGSGIAMLLWHIGKIVWKTDPTKNILAFAVGSGNVGYFGLPIIYALFGMQALGIGVFFQIGIALFETTLGFFLVARGRHSAIESILKIFKLPMIYSFVLGIILSVLHINLGPIIDDTFLYFKGTYSFLGMMIIGMCVTEVKLHSIDFKFIGFALLGRVIFWPIVAFGLIFLDSSTLHLFDTLVYQVAMVMSIVPLAANSISYAVHLNVFPDKVALAVIISTILALFYIPIILNILL